MQRISDRVHKSLCRRTIAWGDNIEAGGLEGQIVQGWLPGHAIKAAQQGLDTINSTNKWVYFDYPLQENPDMPDWMSVLPVEKVHAFA